MRERDEKELERFLRLYLEDQATGVTRGSESYRRLFPSIADDVAREIASIDEAAINGGADDVRRLKVPEWPGADARDLPRKWGELTLLDEIGRGGQAVVYRARDADGAMLAVKVFETMRLDPRTALQRFWREVRIASRLDHPGICPLEAAGIAGATPYIAMPFIEGRSLAELIRGPKPDADGIRRRMEIHVRVARALEYAHGENVIHRDIKPSNVIIDEDGRAVIVDFGLARGDLGGEAGLTESRDVLGSPAYMSPEQISRGPVVPDRRTDIYSLGVSLYESLTGVRPFEAATRAQLMQQILYTPPEPPRRHNAEIGTELSTVVLAALAKHPDERYQSAAGLADDLMRVNERRPILARPPGPWRLLRRWVRRSPGYAAVIMSLAALLVAAMVAASVLWQRAEGRAIELQESSDYSALRVLATEEKDVMSAVSSDPVRAERWIGEIRSVAQRTESHRRTAKRLESQSRAPDRIDRLQATIELAADLGRRADAARRRLDFFESLDRRLVEDAGTWDRVRTELSEDPRFDGIDITPQRGLVPLGKDAESGLQEFLLLTLHTDVERGITAWNEGMPDALTQILVLLPPGTFQMGSPRSERPSKIENEARHRRSVDAFFMGKYEVTQALWTAEMGSNPSTSQAREGWKWPTGPDHPVENIDWNAATILCKRIGARLPIEAEWEYACRAGSRDRYSFGDEPFDLDGAANLRDRSFLEQPPVVDTRDPVGFDDGFALHAPIGRYDANEFGLHDMHGNVSEWCANVYVTNHDRPDARPFDENDRAHRGGSWQSTARDVRSARRFKSEKDKRHATIGFRLARSVE